MGETKKQAENKLCTIHGVMQRFLIYADDYITWNKEKEDWNHCDEFTGTHLDAHKYARSKYGKRYDLNVA